MMPLTASAATLVARFQLLLVPGLLLASPVANEATGQGLVAAPTNLQSPVVRSTSITLLWSDNSTNEVGFRIEARQPATMKDFVQIAQIGANNDRIARYTVSNAAPSTKYEFRVRAYQLRSLSDYSNVLRVATLDPPPAMPTNLATQAVTSTSIELVWTDNSTNENGFEIERSSLISGFSRIATVTAGVRNYTDAGLTSGRSFTYRIRAFNESGASLYTPELAAATRLPAPGAFRVLGATTTQIDLAWTFTGSGQTGFIIERGTAGSTTLAPYRTVGATATTFNDTGLPAATAYTYRVRAVNSSLPASGATGDPSATVTGSTRLGAPTNLTAVAVSGTQVNLTWSHTGTGVESFLVERAQGTTGGFLQLQQVSSTSRAFSDQNVTAGATFRYRVKAGSNATGGFGDPSNEVTVTTTATVPAAPANLVATAVSATQINLAWAASTGATGYQIERATGTGTFTQIAQVGASPTSFTNNTGLTANTTFNYRVRATSAGGSSPFSNVATATTPAVAPATVTASVTLDASIMTSSADPNTANTPFASNPNDVGCNFTQVGDLNNFICGAFLLKFDGLQQQIAGRTVTSARLEMTVRQLAPDRNTTYSIRPFNASWTSSVTFNSAPFTHPSPWVTFSPPTTTTVSIDITPIVQAWANGTRTNFGIGILDNQIGSPFPTGNIIRSTSFHSLDSGGQAPRLVVVMQ